jgi:hypothetical protein
LGCTCSFLLNFGILWPFYADFSVITEATNTWTPNPNARQFFLQKTTRPRQKKSVIQGFRGFRRETKPADFLEGLNPLITFETRRLGFWRAVLLVRAQWGAVVAATT